MDTSNLSETHPTRHTRKLEDDASHMHVYSQVQIPKNRNESRSNVEHKQSATSSYFENGVNIKDLETGYTSFIEDDDRELIHWFDTETGDIISEPRSKKHSAFLRNLREEEWRKDDIEVPTVYDHIERARTYNTTLMDRTGPRRGIRMKRSDRHRYNTPQWHSYVSYDEPSPDAPFYSDTL